MKLLLAILPLVALGIIAVVWTQYSLTRRQLMADIQKEVAALAERTAGAVDGLLRQREHDLVTLSESPLIADYFHNMEFELHDEAETVRRSLEGYLLNFGRRSKVYGRLVYFDRAGREVCLVSAGRVLKGGPARGAAARAFAAARKLPSGSRWVSPVEPLPDGSSELFYARPVHDALGGFRGAIAFSYDLSQVRALLESGKVGRTGTAWIRTPEGDLRHEAGLEPAGRHILNASSPSKERPWRVVVEVPLEHFLGPLRSIRDMGVLIAGAGIAGLALILLWLVRSITRPVAALVEASRRIGAGELDWRIAGVGDDELGALSKSFNEMAGRLEENRRLTLQLQSQLIQAEKLSAAGQLISAVAHEVNNPLAAVAGFVQLSLLEDCPPAMRADLESVDRNVFRCRRVLDNLLFFVRRSREERSRVKVDDAVRAAVEVLRYRLTKTEDVELALELDPSVPDVLGDSQHLAQVLVNLINNACDAMTASPARPEGRRLTVRTGADEDWVRIEVEDNGIGVPAGNRERLFEPFFTTKAAGRGTGLGLPICRQILERHGGDVVFVPREGGGSVFVARLPAAAESELGGLDRPEEPALLPAAPGRRILVVDDEADIAALIARVMRADNDEVEVLAHGPEAIERVRSGYYDLVISDIEMERAKGQDVFAALAQKPPPERPALLFVTGDILNPKVLNFLSKTKSEYLVKPFDLEELQQAARKLLSARPR